MPPTAMTQRDRERLAARLIREERTRFSGVAKDAYTAGGVNPATWKRATQAQTIKPHKLIQIVGRLWPETFGEWTSIPGLNGDRSERPDEAPGRLSRLLEDYVAAHPRTTTEQIARAVGVDVATIAQWRERRLTKSPGPRELDRLADLLELDVRDVLYEVGVDVGLIVEREVEVEDERPGMNTA